MHTSNPIGAHRIFTVVHSQKCLWDQSLKLDITLRNNILEWAHALCQYCLINIFSFPSSAKVIFAWNAYCYR